MSPDRPGPQPNVPADAMKRPYEPPRLHCYGDLRELTLGSSGPAVDSGSLRPGSRAQRRADTPLPREARA